MYMNDLLKLVEFFLRQNLRKPKRGLATNLMNYGSLIVSFRSESNHFLVIHLPIRSFCTQVGCANRNDTNVGRRLNPRQSCAKSMWEIILISSTPDFEKKEDRSSVCAMLIYSMDSSRLSTTVIWELWAVWKNCSGCSDCVNVLKSPLDYVNVAPSIEKWEKDRKKN